MRITPDEITGSAVNGLIARVGVGAGNVLGSFRGSRDGTGEVVYLLDGVNMANPLGTYSGILPGSGPSTELAAYIPDEAIGEAEVLTGGFGAEYPSVQSAVINVVAKEGGKNYAGKFRTKSSTDAIFGWDIMANRAMMSTVRLSIFSRPEIRSIISRVGIGLIILWSINIIALKFTMSVSTTGRLAVPYLWQKWIFPEK